MIVVTNWFNCYEVGKGGGPAKPGEPLRKNRLEYIRSWCHGRDSGTGFRRMQSIAKSRSYEVFGIFQKFLEIAAGEQAGRRGLLWNEKGQPASVSDLAFILDTTEGKVQFAIKVLTHKDVGWLTEINGDSKREICEILGFPGIPGESGDFKTKTKPSVEVKSNQPAGKAGPKPASRKEVEAATAKYIQGVERVFPQRNRTTRETATFNAITQHLIFNAATDKTKLQWLTDAVTWAHQSLSGKRPKGLFVAKIKKQTGYKKKAQLL